MGHQATVIAESKNSSLKKKNKKSRELMSYDMGELVAMLLLWETKHELTTLNELKKLIRSETYRVKPWSTFINNHMDISFSKSATHIRGVEPDAACPGNYKVLDKSGKTYNVKFDRACDQCECNTIDCGHRHDAKCDCHFMLSMKIPCSHWFAVAHRLHANPFMKCYLDPYHWPENHPLYAQAVQQSNLSMADYNIQIPEPTTVVIPQDGCTPHDPPAIPNDAPSFIDMGEFRISKGFYDGVDMISSKAHRHANMNSICTEIMNIGKEADHEYRIALVALAALRAALGQPNYVGNTLEAHAIGAPPMKKQRMTEKQNQRTMEVRLAWIGVY